MSNISIAIWGVVKGEKHEQLLCGGITNNEHRDRILARAKAEGVEKVRVQTVNLSQPADFGKIFGRTVNF